MNSAELHKLFIASSGISTDTRKIEKHTIFFALKGSNFNGNEFALKALELGCSYPGEFARFSDVSKPIEVYG